MRVFEEIKRRARHVIGPAFGICAVCYFAYHTVSGDRGLVAWRQLQEQVATTGAELAAVRSEREQLERRVHLLSPSGVDRDMLDEAARRVLNYGEADEVVINLQVDHGKSR